MTQEERPVHRQEIGSGTSTATGPALATPGETSSFDSARYWDERYRHGGTSGAGSYNRLAHFKSETLNGFVRDNAITSVIEFGCGDGAQLALASYPAYVGVDVSPTAVAKCQSLFINDRTKQFFHPSALPPGISAELALSLDVVYHLIEDAVFADYMHRLFAAAGRSVIVYASNEDAPWNARHVRHRRFTRWVAAARPDWQLVEVIRNKYPFDPNDQNNTSFADFHVFARKAD